MKKNIIKIFAVVLSVMMLSTVLIGCKNKKDDNTISVLLVENAGRIQESQDTPVTLALEEKFGIDFKFITESSYVDVTNTLGRFASRNEIPDLVIATTDTLNQYSKFFVNYNDYRSKMPDMFKYVDEDAVRKQLVGEKGDFYFSPMIYDISTYVVYMIRTDWLENLGYDEGWVPDTFDEFDEVMRAFANDDPNMDGSATKEYGFYPMGAGSWLREYSYNFGVSPGTMIKDGHVVYGPLQPEYKEAITYLNDLYQAGVIDPEFIVDDGNLSVYKEHISTGRVGFTRAFFNRVEDCIAWSRIKNPDAEWKIILPPLNEKTGKRYEQNYMERLGVNGISINKTISDAKKEKLIEMINYLYSKEGQLLTQFGVEGETYDMVNGKPVFKDIVTNNPKWPDSLTTKTYFGIEPATHFAMVQNKDSFIYEPEAMEGIKLYEDYDAEYNMYGNLVKAPPSLTMSYTDDEKDAATVDWLYLSGKEGSGTYEFIRGKRKFSTWDSFINELKTYRLAETISTIDSAYQRIMKY